VKRGIWLWVTVGEIVALTANEVLKFGAAVLIYLAHQPASGILYWALSLIVIVLSEGAGGYVAARQSGPRGATAALAVGIVSLCLVLAGFAFAGIATLWPWWMHAIYAALIVPSAVLGGRLVSKRA
jgi:hypothetical protein